MTPEASNKFTDDFNTAHEFLLLVSTELIKAKKNRTITDFDELNEMLFNVVDVHQRLTALERTASDYKFLSTILYLEYYCCVCIHAHESLKKNGTFEEEILLEIEAQGMPCSNNKKTHRKSTHQSLSDSQNAPIYIPPQKRPKSQQFPNYETQIFNNNDNPNPYQQLQNNDFYYPQPSIQQTHINKQLERERHQIQQLYETHLQTSNQPIFMPPTQQSDNNDDIDDLMSWSQYPSVTPATFNLDANLNDNQIEDSNELPLPPFAPPPYVPSYYAPAQ